MENPLPFESRMVHIIEIGCAQNCPKAWENWAQIGLFGAFGGGILKKLKRSNFRPKIISFEPNEKFCTQSISITCTILNSGSKGLSILNVSAGSIKIQLILLF